LCDRDFRGSGFRGLCRAAPGLLLATPYKVVALNDEQAEAEGVRWWEELTARGGEGIAMEGIAITEAFRGDVLVWVRLGADATVARCHVRDASWFQWPLLEAAIENNIVADFPLCNKSFNCSYSGHDL